MRRLTSFCLAVARARSMQATLAHAMSEDEADGRHEPDANGGQQAVAVRVHAHAARRQDGDAASLVRLRVLGLESRHERLQLRLGLGGGDARLQAALQEQPPLPASIEPAGAAR
jgi:hypothetical protein